MPVREDDGTPFDTSVAVAVIGGGACGLVAALASREAGAAVAVFEREASPGGSTALSSGMIPACGTALQRAAGILDDTPQLMAADIRRKARDAVDTVLLETMCRESGPAIDWLVDAHGIGLELVEGPLYPGHSRHRTHAPPSRRGADLVVDLLRAGDAADVDILCNARVTGLVMGADRMHIAGLIVERPDGRVERIGCNAVVLASSGFGGNPDLVRRFLPDIAEGAYFGHTGNTGDAVLWGEALGACMRDMGAYQGHGSIVVPHGALLSWTLMAGGGILVNAEGGRFANEEDGSSDLAPAVVAQPGGIAWAVYDGRLHEVAMRFDGYRELAALGAVRKAEDARRLAARCALPDSALARTLAETADCAEGRRTDPLGRNFKAGQPLRPPFCAVRVTGGLLHTQGGLAVDETARVLRGDGTPFANLFAGGGAAAGVSGPAHWGYLSGNGLLSAITLGRVAGREAAAVSASRL